MAAGCCGRKSLVLAPVWIACLWLQRKQSVRTRLFQAAAIHQT